MTGLVKFQKPSSPRQPPEFDMTLQIFLPHLRFGSENLEGHVKFWGLPRTTWPMLHLHPFWNRLLIIEFSIFFENVLKFFEENLQFSKFTDLEILHPYINLAVVHFSVTFFHVSIAWPNEAQTEQNFQHM